MTLSTTTDFDETSTTAAEFNAQKIVQSNSPTLSTDVNVLVEKALRRTKYLNNVRSVVTTTTTVLNPIGSGGGSAEVFNTFPGDTLSSTIIEDLANVAVGDVIDVSLLFDAIATVVAGDYVLTLIAIEDYGGAATQTDIPGARRFWTPAAANRYILSLQGVYTIVTAGPLRVVLEVALPSGGVQIASYGTGSLIVRRTHVGA